MAEAWTCAFGAENALMSAALQGNDEAAGLPVTNLQNDQGAASTAWRVPGKDAYLIARLPRPTRCRGFSFHRSNLTVGARYSLVARIGETPVVITGGQTSNTVAGQFLVVFPAEFTIDRLDISISDPGNPDSYLSFPLAYLGPLWQPERNMSWQGNESRQTVIDEATSLSGVEYPSLRYRQRALSIEHQSLGVDELATIRSIESTAAIGRNVLFIPSLSAPDRDAAMIFGRLTLGEISCSAGAADRRGTSMTIKERL
ncbi:hypothetical protein [Asaia krungthepensis]|uniref:Uncharacterized protein n=1 Tax=Asaia krungthepensis NRIC 0535 TaxID=1307925 RepID=A0ABQ0Q3B1_9PROT|nr:hypothetical protein [Asaia krungthepensis]GBQ89296.1 hypothetical protein AA0535_1758 [Asaia krungthepensis NRIC 0535]